MPQGWRHEENRGNTSSGFAVRCLVRCEIRESYGLYAVQKTEQIGNPRIPRRLPESLCPRPRHFCDRVVRPDAARTAERYAIVRHLCRGNLVSCGGRPGGGGVRVKDKLKISFHIVAEPLSESEEITPRNRR